jgi:hypothetical protein
MAINFTNIFHCKTLQNLPKRGFWVWKFTIWQPWRGRVGRRQWSRWPDRAKFSSFRWQWTLGSFFKMTRAAHIFGILFPAVKFV